MGTTLSSKVKEFLVGKNFVTTRSNHAKYVRTSPDGSIKIFISAYVGSSTILYTIGGKEYTDNFNEYSVWVEKKGEVVYTVSGAATGDFPTNSLEDAVTSTIEDYLE